jgi:acetyl esterase/lipase
MANLSSHSDDSYIHPELRLAARFVPRLTPAAGSGRRSLWLARIGVRLASVGSRMPGVRVENLQIPGPARASAVRVRVYRPQGLPAGVPGLLWLHGGGYYMGAAVMDDWRCAVFARQLGLLVVSVDYRLAPEHPFPAGLDDAYAALIWLQAHAGHLGVDASRLAIGGESAGGGLAAALAQLAHDRQAVRPVFQLLIYPMLDDRTTLRSNFEDTHLRVWLAADNRYGWTAYLGHAPGAVDLPACAAAARRTDLAGLPPAWIGVGTIDLFHDEDLAYARRLQECGVACEIMIVPGAYHGFDSLAPRANVVKEFQAAQVAALKRAFSSAAGKPGGG